MRIDSHHHFWNLSQVAYPWLTPQHGPIYDTFEPARLLPHLQAAGIDKTVIVQSANSYEDTASMLIHSDYYDWMGGVVGWVNLLDPDETARRVAMYTRHPKFRGVRHLIHDEPDPDWVVQEVAIESLKILAAHDVSFDVVAVFPNHIKHIPTLVERIPGLRMVIDHLAKPPIGQLDSAWFDQMRTVAESPDVYAKVSGQFDNPAWTPDDVRPFVDFVIQHFTSERLMFGSDWPVCLLGGSYESVWANTQSLLAGCSEAEKAAILGGTAAQFYRL